MVHNIISGLSCFVQEPKERLGSADTGYGTGKAEEELGEVQRGRQGVRDTPGQGVTPGGGGGRVRDTPAGGGGGAQRTEL